MQSQPDLVVATARAAQRQRQSSRWAQAGGCESCNLPDSINCILRHAPHMQRRLCEPEGVRQEDAYPFQVEKTAACTRASALPALVAQTRGGAARGEAKPRLFAAAVGALRNGSRRQSPRGVSLPGSPQRSSLNRTRHTTPSMLLASGTRKAAQCERNAKPKSPRHAPKGKEGGETGLNPKPPRTRQGYRPSAAALAPERPMQVFRARSWVVGVEDCA